MKNGRFGFVNNKQKAIIKPAYTFAEPFAGGLAVVEKNLKFGYIDKKGKVIIPLVFSDAGSFSEGLAYIAAGGKYGYIDKSAKNVIACNYQYAESFKNGLARVRIENPDTSIYGKSREVYGLIDKNGKLLAEQWFSSISATDTTMFRALIKNTEYSVDRSGKTEAVNKEKKPVDDTLKKNYSIVEEMPKFPGGDEGLMQFLKKNIHYPVSAKENGIQGVSYISFVVKKTGLVDDVFVTRSSSPVLDKEALRVVKEMPGWVPGKQDGKTVNVQFTLPVRFQLN